MLRKNLILRDEDDRVQGEALAGKPTKGLKCFDDAQAGFGYDKSLYV